ncbi:MAG: integration host factor subunit alpha [Pseudomonadota bacterium]
MATLTKAQLIESLIEDMGINKVDAKNFVDAFFEEIRISLETGHSVKLSGFGNFKLRDKSARPGRNPKTGQETSITERRVVTFKPGQRLRDLTDTVTQPPSPC